MQPKTWNDFVAGIMVLTVLAVLSVKSIVFNDDNSDNILAAIMTGGIVYFLRGKIKSS